MQEPICMLHAVMGLVASWWWLVVLVTTAQAAVHKIRADDANLRCSNHFVLYEKHCYRYFGRSSKRAYFHAQKQCHRAQSSLVTIHSYNEEEFIVTLTEDNSSFWIGLNDHDGPDTHHKEGIFKWGDEETVAVQYVNWRSGEPANQPHRDCVIAGPQGWAMATTGCASTKLPFVCKRIACPEGLDLFNGVCDIILPQEEHNTAQYCSLYQLLFIISALLLTVLACVLLWACARNNKMATSTKDKTSVAILDKPSLRTTSAIQDLYPT